MSPIEIRHFHFFCGLGGGAKGFNQGHARVGSMEARFRCLGGVDSEPAAIRDFERLAGVPGTCMDLFSREQYRHYHGQEPPADWREATPADIRRAAGDERPHIVFLSAPCKGFSGLLSQKRSTTEKYQSLNALTLRGIWLMCEAWQDDPVDLIVFENVPRIANRGRWLLDQIVGLLEAYGYAVAETTHDCGELGGLAQSRRRFLLVARHQEKVPPYLYEPVRHSLQGVGTILGRMPLPGDAIGGPMHRVPRLQWKTWVRLAFVEAGSDWRSLKRLRVADGMLQDYLIMPERHWGGGQLGVRAWEQPACTVAGESLPNNGHFAVADPRPDWNRHSGNYWIVPFDKAAPTVIAGGKGVQGGQLSVADPRYLAFGEHAGKMRVEPWAAPSHVITGSDRVGSGALSVADPRPALSRERGDHYLTAGHYGVVPWDRPSYAVAGSAGHDNGHWSVADPRMPAASDKLVAVIRALDDTWHRPFTTLELAALQGLVEPEEHLQLEGLSDSAWRERIGNAVPPPAAAAIAGVMAETLLLAWSGQTFTLSSTPVWVRPVAIALAVARPGNDLPERRRWTRGW